MAITGLEFIVLTSLESHGVLPAQPAVLELGESNWYGDVPIAQLEHFLRQAVKEPARRDALLTRLQSGVAKSDGAGLYELAQVFFHAVLNLKSYSAIDPGNSTARYKFDLNLPVPIDELFDFTINIGTAEHVFNVYQFFRTAHERTRPGGLMMHSSPFLGWADHGFYNFQPTFFFDLARVNGYEILSFICGSIKPLQIVQIASHDDVFRLLKERQMPANSHLNVVFRRSMTANPFIAPTQAYYAGALTKEVRRLWHEMR